MTNEYKIAILLPTRGRTEALDRSLIGLLEQPHDLDSIQLLLGLGYRRYSWHQTFSRRITTSS
jgi:hypothetical protein